MHVGIFKILAHISPGGDRKNKNQFAFKGTEDKGMGFPTLLRFCTEEKYHKTLAVSKN